MTEPTKTQTITITGILAGSGEDYPRMLAESAHETCQAASGESPGMPALLAAARGWVMVSSVAHHAPTSGDLDLDLMLALLASQATRPEDVRARDHLAWMFRYFPDEAEALITQARNRSDEDDEPS